MGTRQISNDLVIQGRRFVQEGDQWIETAVQKMPRARRIRVRFDSKEYFELFLRHPHDMPIISGARNLQVVLDNTIYEIYG